MRSNVSTKGVQSSGAKPKQVITINSPEQTAQQFVKSSEAEQIAFEFNPATAIFNRSGNHLVVSFERGGKVTLEDFFVSSNDKLPTITLPDGTAIQGSDFLRAQNPDMDLSTAMGPSTPSGTPSSGLNPYDGEPGDLIEGIDRLGTLDPMFWATDTMFPIADQGITTESFTGVSDTSALAGVTPPTLVVPTSPVNPGGPSVTPPSPPQPPVISYFNTAIIVDTSGSMQDLSQIKAALINLSAQTLNTLSHDATNVCSSLTVIEFNKSSTQHSITLSQDPTEAITAFTYATGNKLLVFTCNPDEETYYDKSGNKLLSKPAGDDFYTITKDGVFYKDTPIIAEEFLIPREVAQFVDNLKEAPNRSTNIEAALGQTYQWLDAITQENDNPNQIYLLTDGNPKLAYADSFSINGVECKIPNNYVLGQKIYYAIDGSMMSADDDLSTALCYIDESGHIGGYGHLSFQRHTIIGYTAENTEIENDDYITNVFFYRPETTIIENTLIELKEFIAYVQQTYPDIEVDFNAFKITGLPENNSVFFDTWSSLSTLHNDTIAFNLYSVEKDLSNFPQVITAAAKFGFDFAELAAIHTSAEDAVNTLSSDDDKPHSLAFIADEEQEIYRLVDFSSVNSNSPKLLASFASYSSDDSFQPDGIPALSPSVTSDAIIDYFSTSSSDDLDLLNTLLLPEASSDQYVNTLTTTIPTNADLHSEYGDIHDMLTQQQILLNSTS